MLAEHQHVKFYLYYLVVRTVATNAYIVGKNVFAIKYRSN